MPICALVVRAPGGWALKQRTRTSWDYDPEIRDAMKCLQEQIRLYYSRLGGEVK